MYHLLNIYTKKNSAYNSDFSLPQTINCNGIQLLPIQLATVSNNIATGTVFGFCVRGCIVNTRFELRWMLLLCFTVTTCRSLLATQYIASAECKHISGCFCGILDRKLGKLKKPAAVNNPEARETFECINKGQQASVNSAVCLLLWIEVYSRVYMPI